MEGELGELKQQIITLEAQVTSYKVLCESQQVALNDKNALLEQFQQLNDSLKGDLEAMKKLAQSASTSGGMGFSCNPWDENGSMGREPEQFRMLFVGNLSFATTDDTLREHFQKFGEIEKAVVKIDTKTQKSRGFGFVVFKTCAMVDNAQISRPHILNGRNVDTKRALPKEDGAHSENIHRTNDLFIGGLSRETTEDELRAYFDKFGKLTHFKMPTAPNTNKSKGFAFVSYEDYDTVDKLVLIKHHTIGGFRAEVRKKVPLGVHMNLKEKKESAWGNKHKQDDYNAGYNSNNRGGPSGGFNDGGNQNKRPRQDFSGNQFNRIPTLNQNMPQPPPVMSQPPPMSQANTAPQSSLPMDIANMPNVDSAQAQALAAYFSTLAKANNQPSSQPAGNNSYNQASNQPNSNTSYNQPISQPSNQPSSNNSYNQSSNQPSNNTYSQPISQPSNQPSNQPNSNIPFNQPSNQATSQPTGNNSFNQGSYNQGFN